MSSGSSLGSLTSTGSQGSQCSVAASLSDIYANPCHQLTRKLPEIDRDALWQRVERLLTCSNELPTNSVGFELDHVTSSTSESQDSVVNSSLDVVSGVRCLPTYEQHLEQQRCRRPPPPPLPSQSLTNSLQALSLGPLVSQPIASVSTSTGSRCLPTETIPVIADVQCEPPSSSTSHALYRYVEQTGNGVGVSGDVNRSTSRRVMSGTATEPGSGSCDASVHQWVNYCFY